MDEKKEILTYINIFKCRQCSLEFALFSNESDWSKKFVPFCPECGKQDIVFLRVATSEKPVSLIVHSDKLGKE